MPGQRRVELGAGSVVSAPGPLVAVDVRELGRSDGVRTVLSLASGVDPAWLETVHPERVAVSRSPVWNEATMAVEEAETHAYDGLVFRKRHRPVVDPKAAAEILVARIVAKEIRLDRWDDSVDYWIARTRCVGDWFPEREMIRYDEDDICVILHEIVEGAVRYSQVRNTECLGYLQQALSWKDRQFVEQMAPTEIRLPSGARLRLRYDPAEAPRGKAKIQELYDLADTPTVAGGRKKVLLEILGPNYRPVQVTDDLKSFWDRTYPELKKVLRRRYPKHEWR
jgi:ATP-dependent helicase HrpB